MQKIIYSSDKKIEWDAQSAFKITNYYTDKENCMVFCYLKQYVHGGKLKLCTYCFDKEASGTQDLQLCFNLNPEQTTDYIHIQFGIDGIDNVFAVKDKAAEPVCIEGIEFRSFTSNDQQGFYWCGEITLSENFINRYFSTFLKEKSIILMNFYKIFPEKEDHGSLFPDPVNIITEKADCMEQFVVLNY